MRVAVLLLATAGLYACGPTKEDASESGQAPAVHSAAVTFDGADYKTETEKLAHGKRLTRVLGCYGCHGDDLQGTNVTEDDTAFGDMNAPNLTLLMASYSDAELDRVIRGGVPKDGREFWFMPSEAYQFLSDADLAALIANLRATKPSGEPMPPIRIGPELRRQAKEGILVSSQGMIARFRDQGPPELGEKHHYGRQLSRMICAECHNSSLQGFEGFTPNLDIAGAYTHAELETLLITGKGKSKPDLGLMSLSAGRFAKLTERERSAIVAYVKARAERQTETGEPNSNK